MRIIILQVIVKMFLGLVDKASGKARKKHHLWEQQVTSVHP